MKKEALQKTQRGSFKRPLMKKRHPKNTNGLVQKTSDEKRGTPKNSTGLVQKTSIAKIGTPQNAKGLLQAATIQNRNSTKAISQ
jgi:hypothetical protein